MKKRRISPELGEAQDFAYRIRSLITSSVLARNYGVQKVARDGIPAGRLVSIQKSRRVRQANGTTATFTFRFQGGFALEFDLFRWQPGKEACWDVTRCHLSCRHVLLTGRGSRIRRLIDPRRLEESGYLERISQQTGVRDAVRKARRRYLARVQSETLLMEAARARNTETVVIRHEILGSDRKLIMAGARSISGEEEAETVGVTATFWRLTAEQVAANIALADRVASDPEFDYWGHYVPGKLLM